MLKMMVMLMMVMVMVMVVVRRLSQHFEKDEPPF